MTRVSLSTALASLLMLCGVSDALATPRDQKSQGNGSAASAERRYEYDTEVEHYASTVPSVDIGGILITHGWFSSQDDYYRGKGIERGGFPSEYSRKHGFASDGMLHISAEGGNDALGISYGGSLELDIPHVQRSEYVSFKQVGNRGASVFLNTRFGDLRAGYLEGVDALMKVDAFSIAAGDNSNLWMRYVNLRDIHDPLENSDAAVDLPSEMRKRYLENAFYLSTGLYSQSILEGGNRFSRGALSPCHGTSLNLVNAMPFRFSYTSPSLGGLRLGVSYSPFGYDEDKVTRAHVARKLVTVPNPDGILGLNLGLRGNAGTPVEVRNARSRYIMPLYEHVVNVAVTYKAYIGGMDFKVSAVSEYAKSKTELLSEHVSFARMDDMRNVALGGMLGYKNLKLAASYGYLGAIDRVNNMYDYDENSGKFALNDQDKVLIKTESTSFWTIGGGYEYDRAYISVVYRGSNYSGNELDEIAFGAEYYLSSDASRVDCSIFANHHYFRAQSSAVLDGARTSGVNKGRVVLAGMKVRF
ncbi:porin [Anaplasma capra]|uniref:porin n=1 Tax=Anaplasma capra TaxID=1562740 RepID=UPI0021D5DFD8|nr:porin [Anaplasma capra]MCU7611568.1 porin [Anaplasma capra]MCU7611993.1 porin [Anaplasma capra]